MLERTLGVPLFQEQAMQIAIVAAGFSGNEADQLRRAMATFKKQGEISHFREKMVNGMIKRGYDKDFALRCFRQIEGFGTYGFQRSHAASFCASGLCFGMVEMSLSGCVYLCFIECSTDGVLCTIPADC